MSSASFSDYQSSIPMSVSGSSATSETPESEHALSVLDFAERSGQGAARQVSPEHNRACLLRACACQTVTEALLDVLQYDCPRSSASRRKRQRDVWTNEDERQSKPVYLQHQTFGTVQQFQKMAVSPPSAVAGSQHCTLSPTTYYVAIHNCLVQWCCRLKALQPKCIITRDVLHRSLDLFHRYRQALQIAVSSSGQRQGATAVHLAACLWVASKNDGNRACVPSRTLLTRAIAVCPEELTKAELTVCCTLKWNLFNCEVASALHCY